VILLSKLLISKWEEWSYQWRKGGALFCWNLWVEEAQMIEIWKSSPQASNRALKALKVRLWRRSGIWILSRIDLLKLSISCNFDVIWSYLRQLEASQLHCAQELSFQASWWDPRSILEPLRSSLRPYLMGSEKKDSILNPQRPIYSAYWRLEIVMKTYLI
jgi:hypothetical protein